MESKFCICRHCGNLVFALHDAGVSMVCCSEKMEQLKANESEIGSEKHMPVVAAENGKVHVNVGAVSHPMIEGHSIEWIYVQSHRGGQFKRLSPGDDVQAVFAFENDEPEAVYAYCNLHGLWMTRV